MVDMNVLKLKGDCIFYMYSVSWNHPRLPFDLFEVVRFYNKCMAIDPCDDKGPKCHGPHQPKVQFGCVGLRGQGGKS